MAAKKQTIVPASSANSIIQSKQTGRISVEYESLNEDRTVQTTSYAPNEIKTYLKQSTSRVNIIVPPILKRIAVVWDLDQSDGYFFESGQSEDLSVTDGSVSRNSSGNISGSASANPVLDIEIEQIWANDLVATNYYYFVENPNGVLSTLNSLTGISAKDWPLFKPKIYSITSVGKSVSSTARWAFSKSKSKSEDREAESRSEGEGKTGSIESNVDVTKIGPCLCSGISLSGEARKKVTARVTGSYTAENFTDAIVQPASFSATTPTDVPRSGFYLIDSRVESYKWGYFKVVATVIDASQLK